MDGLIKGFALPIGDFAARSVIERLKDAQDTEDINRYEKEVMEHVFKPDDKDKLAGKCQHST